MLRIDARELTTLDGYQFFYRDEPFTGLAYEINPNGGNSLLSEIEYKYGAEDGWKRIWYPSGQLRVEAQMEDNNPRGVWREWYENGQMRRETVYAYRELLANREWYSDGTLIPGSTEARRETERALYDAPWDARNQG